MKDLSTQNALKLLELIRKMGKKMALERERLIKAYTKTSIIRFRRFPKGLGEGYENH